MSLEGDVNAVKRTGSPEVIDEPTAKKQRISEEPASNAFAIAAQYSDNVEALAKLYAGQVEAKDVPAFVDNQSQMIADPFRVMELKNFLRDDGVIASLSEAATGLELNKKNNDLYSYKVSDEMAISDQQFEPLLNFLRNDVRSFLQTVTGESLNEQISVTVSRYDQGDYLLCHDDQLEGRRIAFVLYLVDDQWSDADGGQFQMFNVDKADNQPLEIVKSLVPKRNAFNFFVVAPNTYHQVAEVLTGRSPRWSVNGWFHSDTATIVPRSYSFPLLSSLYSPFKNQDAAYDVDYELFTSWISSKYLIPEFQQEVRKMFETKSEIQLPEFFNVKKFNALKKTVEGGDLAQLWKTYFRPAYAKFQYVSEDDKKPEIVEEAIRVFRSEAFFLLLSQLTGIVIHKKALEDFAKEQAGPSTSSSSSAAVDDNKPEVVANPICRGELRKWRKGDYSLASNESPDFKEVWGLDVMFFMDQFEKATILDDVKTPAKKTEDKEPKDEGEKADKAAAADEEDEDEEDEDFEISNRALYDSESEEDSENSGDESGEAEDEDDDEEEGDDEDEEDENGNKHGGVVVYIDDESPEELMTFAPAENCLNIVYRMKGTQRFMKYINATGPLDAMHEFAFVYTDGDLYNV